MPDEILQDPDNSWTVSIDRNGNVLSVPSRPEDIAARPPIAVTFEGTHSSEGQDVATQNETDFNKAIFELSQTDSGRALLRAANELGYSFRFDTESCQKRNFGAYCSHSPREIVFKSGQSVTFIATTLGHEIKHAYQMHNNSLSWHLELDPRSQLKVSHAMEADARVTEFRVAYELKFGTPGGPSNQYRSNSMVQMLRNQWPEMAEVAEKHAHLIQKGRYDEFSARVFPSYYKLEGTVKFYENDATNIIADLDPARIKNPDFLNKTVSSDEIKSSLTNLEGRPYLDDHAPLLDLDRGEYSGMHTKTIERLKEVEATRQENPELANERWQLQERPSRIGSIAESLRQQADSVFGRLKRLRGERHQLTQDFTETAQANPGGNLSGFSVIVIPTPEQMQNRIGDEGREETYQKFVSSIDGHLNGIASSDPLFAYELAIHDADPFKRDGFRSAFQLVEGGYKAPMAAFPEQYLLKLGRRIQGSARANPDNPLNSLDPHERSLVYHWIELEERGHGMKSGGLSSRRLDAEHYYAADMVEDLVKVSVMPALKVNTPKLANVSSVFTDAAIDGSLAAQHIQLGGGEVDTKTEHVLDDSDATKTPEVTSTRMSAWGQSGGSAAGLAMGAVGLTNAIQSGDTTGMVISGADVIVSGGDLALDVITAAGGAVSDGLKGVASKANIAVMVVDGVYQISQEQGLENKVARGVAVVGTTGTAFAVGGTAATIGATGVLATTATVTAPIVAAVAVGMTADAAVDAYKVTEELEDTISRNERGTKNRDLTELSGAPSIASYRNLWSYTITEAEVSDGNRELSARERAQKAYDHEYSKDPTALDKLEAGLRAKIAEYDRIVEENDSVIHDSVRFFWASDEIDTQRMAKINKTPYVAALNELEMYRKELEAYELASAPGQKSELGQYAKAFSGTDATYSGDVAFAVEAMEAGVEFDTKLLQEGKPIANRPVTTPQTLRV